MSDSIIVLDCPPLDTASAKPVKFTETSGRPRTTPDLGNGSSKNEDMPPPPSKTLHDSPPQRRERYQRRNSAVASMLFPASHTVSSSMPSLELSSAFTGIKPLEALMKARQLLEELPELKETNLNERHATKREIEGSTTDHGTKRRKTIPGDFARAT